MVKMQLTYIQNVDLPAALDLVSTIIGESAAQKLKPVPLSNNTISRRIDKISEDIHDQFVTKIAAGEPNPPIYLW